MILKYTKQLNLIQPYLKQQDLLTRKFSKKSKKSYLLKKKKSIFSLDAQKVNFCKPFYKDVYLAKTLFFHQSKVPFWNDSSWNSPFLFRPFVFYLPLLTRDTKSRTVNGTQAKLVPAFYKELLYSELKAVSIKNDKSKNQIKIICYKKSLKNQLYKKVRFIQKLCLPKQQIDQKAKALYVREDKATLKEKKNSERMLENKAQQSNCNFYQLDPSQKLQLLYPTNLDKMSFLSMDLANLSLSLNTYTFLKKKNLQKVGNLLEYTPKDLLRLLNLNRDMFVEIKTCFLLLGLWRKNSVV